jgi:hypothetical protein
MPDVRDDPPLHGLGQLHAVTGRCACGAVTFSCLVESETAICSCDLCRRNSGSAFQGWVDGERASMEVDGAVSSWASTEHASRHFCRHCGSALVLFERDTPAVVEIATGTLDEPHGIISARVSQDYAHQRPSWARLPNAVE